MQFDEQKVRQAAEIANAKNFIESDELDNKESKHFV